MNVRSTPQVRSEFALQWAQRAGFAARRAVVYAAFMCTAGLTGCELDRTPIAPTTPILIVHSVLSRSAFNQTVLLERSLSGRVLITELPYNSLDPIISGGGLAETGAMVTIERPDGTIVIAREDISVRPDGLGAGVYRAALPGNSLEEGKTYRLHVRTLAGEELSATTTIPFAAPAIQTAVQDFDRDGAPLSISWTPHDQQARYAVLLESPFGTLTSFTDIATASLSGSLRHTTVEGLPRVFTAGFLQTVNVLAIDANYYDYFRTRNQSWSGAGIVSRISGGIGVFGSVARVHTRTVRVTKTRTAPIEARFEYRGTDLELASSIARGLELFIESPAHSSAQPDAISGHYLPNMGSAGGVIGTFREGTLRIAFLRGYNLSDTLEVFTGQLSGDTLAGTYRNYGVPGRFVRMGHQALAVHSQRAPQAAKLPKMTMVLF